jgi:hypothetical protein
LLYSIFNAEDSLSTKTKTTTKSLYLQPSDFLSVRLGLLGHHALVKLGQSMKRSLLHHDGRQPVLKARTKHNVPISCINSSYQGSTWFCAEKKSRLFPDLCKKISKTSCRKSHYLSHMEFTKTKVFTQSAGSDAGLVL